ncbi:10980_t:CDS:2, partial [Gigaspora rosea]
DGRFNHAHRRSTKHLDFIDKWDNDKLPDDDFLSLGILQKFIFFRFHITYKLYVIEFVEIAVPLKHQPSFSEENENFDLVPEQLKPGANNKWKDLALDFFRDECKDANGKLSPHNLN